MTTSFKCLKEGPTVGLFRKERQEGSVYVSFSLSVFQLAVPVAAAARRACVRACSSEAVLFFS